jgi:phage terminase large subunit-like protein
VTAAPPWPSPLDFFARLKWIDGAPLMATIEPYRRDLFLKALYTFRDDGVPVYNLVVNGRAKKNWKSSDLVLAALFKLLIPETVQGNDAFVLANDEDQAGDDLGLAKKLVEANALELGAEVEIQASEIKRKDGRGSLQILPARNAVGQHGKTAGFIGFDEMHGYRNYDLLEALAPDPTRPDANVDHVLRHDLQHAGHPAVRLQGPRQGWRRSSHAVQLVQRRLLL